LQYSVLGYCDGHDGYDGCYGCEGFEWIKEGGYERCDVRLDMERRGMRWNTEGDGMQVGQFGMWTNGYIAEVEYRSGRDIQV
jgi:hypothetical protein